MELTASLGLGDSIYNRMISGNLLFPSFMVVSAVGSSNLVILSFDCFEFR
jgi:hypothetical protein